MTVQWPFDGQPLMSIARPLILPCTLENHRDEYESTLVAAAGRPACRDGTRCHRAADFCDEIDRAKRLRGAGFGAPDEWLAASAQIPRPDGLTDISVVRGNRFELTGTRADVIFAFFGSYTFRSLKRDGPARAKSVPFGDHRYAFLDGSIGPSSGFLSVSITHTLPARGRPASGPGRPTKRAH